MFSISKTKNIVIGSEKKNNLTDGIYTPASSTNATDFPEEFEDFLKMIAETRINNERYNQLVEVYAKKYKSKLL